MIILDFSGGNICKNDKSYIKRMIDKLAEIDLKRQCIIKWQLFLEAGNNIPLTHECFNYAYNYAESLGFKTTASIFDIESLNFLLKYDPCFVKIANRYDLYWLIEEIPRRIPVIVSCNDSNFGKFFDGYYNNQKKLYCISKYPADIKDYYILFTYKNYYHGISDHTSYKNNFELYKKYKPEIYEIHYVLEYDINNPDGGEFAHTPDQIKNLLEIL